MGTVFKVTTGVGKTNFWLVYIEYETNILGINGPRKMKIYIPKLD